MMTTTTFKAPDDPDLIYVQNRDIDISVINEYAEMMKTGIEFDACSGIIDSEGKIYVWDGNHRGQAAIRAGKSIRITLEDGTREGAEWMALSANTKHGLRRSRKDKQRIIHDALKHRHSTHRSNREIARHCGVDHKTIGKIRADLVASGEIPQIAEKTVTRNGTEYQQAAKAEPEYVPIWQLERATRAWLEKKWTTPDLRIKALFMIKQGNRDLLDELCKYQRKPHRRQDVRQACNNTLDQITQERVKAYKEAKAEPTKADTRCTKCGQPGEVFYKQLWKCKSCYIEIQEAIANETDAKFNDLWSTKTQPITEMPKATTVPTLHCAKCSRQTWQQNPPDNPEEIFCWHCSPKKAEMMAEDEARAAELEAKQVEHTAEIERKNAEAMARIKAYKDPVTREATTVCLACAPTFNPAAWARDRAQDICPDCLRALGEAMIEAAKEIEIQN